MTSSGFWKLNGRTLASSQVRIFPLGGSKSATRRVRQSLVDLHGGTQSRENVGMGLPTFSIEFRFNARGIQKWAERTWVHDILESDDIWTLEANVNGRIWKNHKRAAFSATEITENDLEGTGRIALRVSAILNGVWVADGGTYCESLSGSFTLQPDGTWVNNETGENTGSSPLLELPAQYGGYPHAVRASDYAMATPTVASTRSGPGPDGVDTVHYQTFDLTGFLIPAPASAGDVGIYQVCSSPTYAFLQGGDDDAEPMGIGEGSLDEYEVAGPIDAAVGDGIAGGGIGSSAIADGPIGGP